jgi:sulfite reductase beta subunit-like hemoprotein
MVFTDSAKKRFGDFFITIWKVTGEQLERITKVSDEYSTGRLHITTRQDIQIHYVSLDRTLSFGQLSNR